MKGFFWSARPPLFVHPITGELHVVTHENDHVRARATPAGVARALTCARETQPHSTEDLVVLCEHEDGSIHIEYQDITSAKTLARFPHISQSLATQPGFLWRHEARIHHVTEATLFCFDTATRQRSHTSPGELPREVLDVLLSPCGRWLICAGRGPGLRARVVSFDLRLPHHPVLHLRDLDTRGIDSPLAHSRQRGGEIKLAADTSGERFFVYYSRKGAQSERWPGWRGSVACFDYETGRSVWHAEVDAEVTGDWRGVDDLMRDEDFVPGLCCHAERLFLGGWDGSVIELDARDGALREAHHHGGIHGVEALTYLEEREELLLLDERGVSSKISAG